MRIMMIVRTRADERWEGCSMVIAGSPLISRSRDWMARSSPSRKGISKSILAESFKDVVNNEDT